MAVGGESASLAMSGYMIGDGTQVVVDVAAAFVAVQGLGPFLEAFSAGIAVVFVNRWCAPICAP